MTRLRTPAQRAPQSKAAAIELLEQFAQKAAALKVVYANRDSTLSTISATADLLAAPLVAEMKEIVKQLKPWWAASIDELTGGKRKSIDLGGCTIGYRISPPKVDHDFAKDDDAVLALQASPYAEQLVRVTYALDKPAILKLLDAQAIAAAAAAEAGKPFVPELDDDGHPIKTLAALGFSSKQTEQFFVDAIAPSSPDASTSIPADPTPA